MQFSGPGDERRGHIPGAVRPGRTDFGGYSEGETPLPIPNREVKPLSADGTWPARARESRSPPFLHQRAAFGAALFSCGLSAVARSQYRYAVVPPDVAAPGTAEALGVIRAAGRRDRPPAPLLGRREDAADGASPPGCADAVSRRDRGVPRLCDVRHSLRPLFWARRSPAGCCSAARRGARRRRRASPLVGLVVAALEGDLRCDPAVRPARAPAQRQRARRTCRPRGRPPARSASCGHLDTTRSGLMFHPRAGAHLARCCRCRPSPALAARRRAAPAPPPGGRALQHAGARRAGLRRSRCSPSASCAARTCPGASDNASGAAVALQLAAECAAPPLEHTEVDLLITGCEESGLLGAQAYARRPRQRAAETTFLNFDTVGGDVPLTYILREGSRPSPAGAARAGRPSLEADRRAPARAGPAAGPDDPGPAHRRDRDARARLGGGHAPRPGGDDPELPPADGHVREHRATRPCRARSRPAASCCARWTPRSRRR